MLAALAIFGVVLVRTTIDVYRNAHVDEARPSDIIVVLGAAGYHGQPSPILKARLDHALTLYRRRLAPRILTTGGSGGDPVFTEGETGRDYLMKNGVPSESILVETESTTTAETTAAITEILRRMNLRSVIVVTDSYHVYRSKRMLEAQGFRVHASPRPSADRSDLRYWYLCTRQAFAYLMWSAGVVV
jgi:uncharacterized SAM-binding protein YcdF (DUF218 family)